MLIIFAASLEIRDDENKLSKAQIGMIVGILLGALLLVIIGVLISRRFSKRKVNDLSSLVYLMFTLLKYYRISTTLVDRGKLLFWSLPIVEVYILVSYKCTSGIYLLN